MRSPLYENVLTGIADACLAQNVTLIGGETAEMPGMYGNDYDLVGCITGIVEKDEIITGENIKPGHVALGLASVGLHTNGFSLARKVLFEKGGFTVDSKPADSTTAVTYPPAQTTEKPSDTGTGSVADTGTGKAPGTNSPDAHPSADSGSDMTVVIVISVVASAAVIAVCAVLLIKKKK